jgi:hypothetical protein
VLLLQQRTTIATGFEQRQLIDDCHRQLGHAGWQKVFQTLRDRFFWPRMRQNVFQQLRYCRDCILHNTPTTTVGTAATPITAEGPNHILAVDVVPMPVAGNIRYMLLAIDHFSKYAMAVPAPSGHASHLVRFLQGIFRRFGPFKELLSDPGPQFRACQLQHLLAQHGVTHTPAARRHFEGNGCLERLVRTINEILAKIGATTHDWPSHLAAALQAYNRRYHSTTNAEPASTFLQCATRLPLDHQYGTQGQAPPPHDEIAQSTDRATRVWAVAAQRKQPTTFTEGQEVLHVPRLKSTMVHARNRRFLPRRRGPYLVIEPYPRNRYLCTDGVKQYVLPGWELQLRSPHPVPKEGGE